MSDILIPWSHGIVRRFRDMGDGTWAEVVAAVDANPVGAVGPPSTPTHTQIPDDDESVLLLAENTSRKGASFTNTSSSTLYARPGTAAVTLANWTMKIPPGSERVLDLMAGGVLTCAVQGIWATDPNDGGCNVMEAT